MAKRLTHEEFIDKLRVKNTNDITVLDTYVNNSTKLHCHCNKCNNNWYVTPNKLLSGRGCPECKKHNLSNLNKKTTEEFKKELAILRQDLIVIGEYNGTDELIEMYCTKHNKTFLQTPHHLLCHHENCGCEICKSEAIKKDKEYTFEEVENKIKEINENIELLDLKQMQGISTFKCKKCGEIFQDKASNLLDRECFCPNCTPKFKSKREEIVEQFLKDKNIVYIREKTFNGLVGVNEGLLSYDFEIKDNEKHILIEIQGEQHDHPVSIFGGEKQFKIQQEHDKRKKEYANKNNIKLFEIWYYEDILLKLEELGVMLDANI